MTSERYFSLDEYRRRWAAVEAEMARRGYQVALVWGKSAFTYERSMDVLYLTNFFPACRARSRIRAPGTRGASPA